MTACGEESELISVLVISSLVATKRYVYVGLSEERQREKQKRDRERCRFFLLQHISVAILRIHLLVLLHDTGAFVKEPVVIVL